VGRAGDRVRKLMSEYTAPAIDPGTAEALDDFIARRKAEEPDAFS